VESEPDFHRSALATSDEPDGDIVVDGDIVATTDHEGEIGELDRSMTVLVGPPDLATDVTSDPEVVVLTPSITEDQVEALTGAIAVRSIPSGEPVGGEVEYCSLAGSL
jgi:hypothetical protein